MGLLSHLIATFQSGTFSCNSRVNDLTFCQFSKDFLFYFWGSFHFHWSKKMLVGFFAVILLMTLPIIRDESLLKCAKREEMKRTFLQSRDKACKWNGMLPSLVLAQRSTTARHPKEVFINFFVCVFLGSFTFAAEKKGVENAFLFIVLIMLSPVGTWKTYVCAKRSASLFLLFTQQPDTIFFQTLPFLRERKAKLLWSKLVLGKHSTITMAAIDLVKPCLALFLKDCL